MCINPALVTRALDHELQLLKDPRVRTLSQGVFYYSCVLTTWGSC
jgi:hypothetical protein